jgi:hypothetical protein
MPEGVSHEGVFGAGAAAEQAQMGVVAPAAGRAYKSNGSFVSRDEAVARPATLPAPIPAKKLHESLAALASGQPAAAGLRVQNGRVAVELWLNDASEQVVASLKALGFEPIGTPKVGKIRAGWIRIDRLHALEALPGVQSVLPFRS